MRLKNLRNEEIEFVKCNICGKDDSENYLLFEDYKYVKCKNCGLIYQNPRPKFKDLKKRYSIKYFKYELKNHKNFFLLMKKSLEDIGFFEKFNPKLNGVKKKFLDIGCATGMLLNYVRKYGWQTKGVEICPQSAEYARKNFQLDVFNGTVEQAKFPDNYFDVIHFSHLIEHLPDPYRMLKEVYRILKLGGYALITTPRVDSFQHWLFKNKWRSYHRDHLYIFSKNTIISLLKKVNFQIIRSFSWGGVAKGFVPLFIKIPLDSLAKLFNLGDVMFLMVKKNL